MRAVAVCLLAMAAAGCDSASAGCRTDRDCPGGACVAGACRPLYGADLAGATDLKVVTTWQPGDGGVPDGLAPACVLNGDGVIDRSELPFIAGLGGLFAVNPSGSAVDVVLAQSGGVWDFRAPVANETRVFDQLIAPGGTWWAADFPTATYAERMEDGQPLLGVYQATAGALELLGVVSDSPGLSQTKLTYATPINVLEFPIQVGASWTAASDVTGTASGVLFVAHETYTFTVTERGTTETPSGNYDSLRLRMNYTQQVGAYLVTRVIYLHLAECYGAVARIRSVDYETSNDFTRAAEYRRLASP